MNKERVQTVINTVLTIVAIVVIIFTVKKGNNNNLYQVSAYVSSTHGTVQQLVDTNGNVWEVEDENLKQYGRYTITLDNQGTTDDITDDTIVEVE